MERKKFWMITSLEDTIHGKPKERHYKYEIAINECKRLTLKEQKPFIVLESTEICEVAESPVIFTKIGKE